MLKSGKEQEADKHRKSFILTVLAQVTFKKGERENIEITGGNFNKTQLSRRAMVIKIATVWPWKAAIFRVGGGENRKWWGEPGLMCCFLSTLWISALGETLQLYVGQRGTAFHCHPHQGSLCAETTCVSPLLPPLQHCSHQIFISVTVGLCIFMVSRID